MPKLMLFIVFLFLPIYAVPASESVGKSIWKVVCNNEDVVLLGIHKQEAFGTSRTLFFCQGPFPVLEVRFELLPKPNDQFHDRHVSLVTDHGALEFTDSHIIFVNRVDQGRIEARFALTKEMIKDLTSTSTMSVLFSDKEFPLAIEQGIHSVDVRKAQARLAGISAQCDAALK